MLEVAARFPLKATVRLRLSQPGAEQIVVEGRVARAKVAALVNGVINYRFAVIFDRPLATVPGVAAGDQLAASVTVAGAPSDAPKALDAPKGLPAVIAPAAAVGGERTLAIVPARPVAVPSLTESDDSPIALRGDLERERTRLETELAAATAELARLSSVNQSLAERLAKSDDLLTGLRHELAAERNRLEQELAAATADLARQSEVIQSLAARLENSDVLLNALHEELQAERGQWEEDRSTLLQQVADAVTVADALQTAQEAREHQHAQTLAEQRDKYESIITELMTSTNDQQTEYEQFVEELTAAADEQRRRADHHEAELASERASSQQDRADAEVRRHELETRLESAESLCAAHDARHLALRGQLEILVALFAAPLSSDASRSDQPALFETEVEKTRAIA